MKFKMYIVIIMYCDDGVYKLFMFEVIVKNKF